MSSRYCRYCNRYINGVQAYQPQHVCHVLVTIVTCGLWLPFWGLACILGVTQGQVCPFCGGKV